jgi:hypothetical protein
MPYNLAELERAETYRYGFLPPLSAPGPHGLVPYQRTETLILKPFHNVVALPATYAYRQHLGRPFYWASSISRSPGERSATMKVTKREKRQSRMAGMGSIPRLSSALAKTEGTD